MKNPKQVLPDAQHHPIEVQNSVDKPKYIAYPKALSLLNVRLHTTPEEVAAWLFMGPEQGGLAAYLNATEFDEPPPKFFYSLGREGDFDYLSPLMGCWFIEENILSFQPTERYITGKALIERWGEQPGLQPEAYIIAKIRESRLMDLHPIYGGIEATSSDIGGFPPLETCLFAISQIEEIEKSDFGKESHSKINTGKMAKVISVSPTEITKPWQVVDLADPEPVQPWYTPARYFARQLVKDDSTLLTKMPVLTTKVIQSLVKVGIYKRGGKRAHDPSTIRKAFSNVYLG
jgi:hypothetical protein